MFGGQKILWVKTSMSQNLRGWVQHFWEVRIFGVTFFWRGQDIFEGIIFTKIFVGLIFFSSPSYHHVQSQKAQSLKRKRSYKHHCHKTTEATGFVGISFIPVTNIFLNGYLNWFPNGFLNEFLNVFFNRFPNRVLYSFWNGLSKIVMSILPAKNL